MIFSETIARNIAVADGEIDTKRLAEAARIACIDGFVESLPLKYNTKIGRDGMGLSQGQKQRLLIARAVYRCLISYSLMKRPIRLMHRTNDR